jgi:MFS family permease
VGDLYRYAAFFTAGFFASHSVASSWIGPRARRARGQASSLYLFSYYLGSSIAGTLGGVFWHNYGWNGVGGFIALMLLLALFVGSSCIAAYAKAVRVNIEPRSIFGAFALPWQIRTSPVSTMPLKVHVLRQAP